MELFAQCEKKRNQNGCGETKELLCFASMESNSHKLTKRRGDMCPYYNDPKTCPPRTHAINVLGVCDIHVEHHPAITPKQAATGKRDVGTYLPFFPNPTALSASWATGSSRGLPAELWSLSHRQCERWNTRTGDYPKTSSHGQTRCLYILTFFS